MNKHLVYPFVLFSLASPSNAQTTTFRGHTLGENWHTFIRTEKGLCRLNDANARACTQAAVGKDATLTVRSEDKVGEASFRFEGGHFVKATVLMKGPKFAELTDLEKTYGKPSRKTSNPEKGEAYSKWDFPDGGKVTASEDVSDSGQAIIRVNISSPEDVLINDTAVSADDEVNRWVDIFQHALLSSKLVRNPSSNPSSLAALDFVKRYEQERLDQDKEDSLSWSPELVEGEYIKQKAGDMAVVCSDEDIERSHRGLLVEGKGCIFVYPSLPVRTPILLRRFRWAIAWYIKTREFADAEASDKSWLETTDAPLHTWTDTWLKVRDLYCIQSPGAKFLDLSGKEGACPP